MTKEEIIDMARQAGARQMVSSLTHPNGPVTALKFDLDSESIKAFAKLVEAKEREACAKIIDDSYETTTPSQGIPEDWLLTLSEAIRARGQE